MRPGPCERRRTAAGSPLVSGPPPSLGPGVRRRGAARWSNRRASCASLYNAFKPRAGDPPSYRGVRRGHPPPSATTAHATWVTNRTQAAPTQVWRSGSQQPVVEHSTKLAPLVPVSRRSHGLPVVNASSRQRSARCLGRCGASRHRPRPGSCHWRRQIGHSTLCRESKKNWLY